LADLTKGAFAAVIDEVDDLAAAQVRRLVFCSGKVYFDLLKTRRKENIRDVALLRIEQLYPFPNEGYEAAIKRYPNVKDVVWCQEEPQNQGAWYQIRHRLQDLAGSRSVYYAGRAAAAAPATGLIRSHEAEQRHLVDTALNAVTAEQATRSSTRLTPPPGLAAAAGASTAERAATPISSAIRKTS
jgi:2-oxoglutarate dehydrogenase E1 component